MTEKYTISKQTLFELLEALGSTYDIEQTGEECGFTLDEYMEWKLDRC